MKKCLSHSFTVFGIISDIEIDLFGTILKFEVLFLLTWTNSTKAMHVECT